MAIILAVLFIAMRGCHRGGALPTAATHPSSTASDAPSRWMENHLDLLGNRPLAELTLPASHDSAMYESGFPQSLARTQNLTIYGQLSAGVRYFDLRPRWRAGEISMHHGIITGPDVAVVLDDVRRFMLDGHRELVILKFSHDDGFSTESYLAMVQQIKSALGPWLYTNLPAGKRLAQIPLADFVQNKGATLVLIDGSFPIENPSPGIWVYRDWSSQHPQPGDLRVYDQYSNVISFDEMKTDQLGKFDRYDGRCENQAQLPCDLFLLSWTLTPPTDVPRYAAVANHQLAAALAG